MRRLPKFVKLIFATVMTLGMYTGITYGGDGAPPKITVQPESQRNVYGANVEFSITATGENLKYQWQYKPRIKGGTWTNSTDSGATTNKLKLVANDQNEYLYRCLVSDDTYSGDKAIMSNAASLYVIDDQIFEIKYISETPTAPVITTQPLSQMLSVGEKATFTVEATGTDLTYQWQYKPSLPNSAWTNLTKSDGTGFDTNTFTTTVLTGTQDHYQYRCLVRSTNYYYGDENAKESDSATLLIFSETQIADVQFDNSKLMITEWTIPADNTVIKLPVQGTGLNITVDWGDGTESEVITTAFPTHTYATAGTYEIKVLGICSEWGYASNSTVKATSDYYTYTRYLTKVKQFGELSATRYGFARCTKLTEVSGENLVTSKTFEKTANMQYMFYMCSSLTNLDVSNFDTSKTINMAYMFSACSKLTSLNINNLDTSEVTNMRNMFSSCSSLTSLNVSDFNTSKVTNMIQMFDGCKGLTSLNVGSFDTSKVESMSYMFSYCSNLTSLDVSKFDTSKVTDMSVMFDGCSKLTSLDVSKFDTSKVRYMGSMFIGCKGLTNLDLSNFDTSKVTDMSWMFSNCSNLTSLDVSKFNTSNVTNLERMFYGCSSLTNLDLSNFNTSKITNMQFMFYGCSSLTSLDLSKFNTSNLTNMLGMFRACNSLISLDLSSFNTSKVTKMSQMFIGCKSLINLDVSTFDTSNVTTMEGMFLNCTSLTNLNLNSFDTSKVKEMNFMFQNCSSLKSLQLSNKFKIPTDITDMFTNTTSLNSIIIVDSEPLASQFTPVVSQLTGKTIYVPSKSAETAYEEAWSGDFSGDRIKPILELVGKENITLNVGDTYTDAGYTVARFDTANSGDYTIYGYNVTTSGEVNTAVAGMYTIEYILTRTYNNGTNVVTEEVMRETRTVNVVDTKSYMITEWNVSGDAGLTITLPVSGTGLNITVDWGDGSATETITTEYPTHTYAQAGIYEIAVAGNCP